MEILYKLVIKIEVIKTKHILMQDSGGMINMCKHEVWRYDFICTPLERQYICVLCKKILKHNKNKTLQARGKKVSGIRQNMAGYKRID